MDGLMFLGEERLFAKKGIINETRKVCETRMVVESDTVFCGCAKIVLLFYYASSFLLSPFESSSFNCRL